MSMVSGDFGDAVGSGKVGGQGHLDRRPKSAAGSGDYIVVGGDHYLIEGLAEAGTFINVL